MSNYLSKNYCVTFVNNVRWLNSRKCMCMGNASMHILKNDMLSYGVVAKGGCSVVLVESLYTIFVSWLLEQVLQHTSLVFLLENINYLGKQQFLSQNSFKVNPTPIFFDCMSSKLKASESQGMLMKHTTQTMVLWRDICLKALPIPRVTQLIPVLKPFSLMHNLQ